MEVELYALCEGYKEHYHTALVFIVVDLLNDEANVVKHSYPFINT